MKEKIELLKFLQKDKLIINIYVLNRIGTYQTKISKLLVAKKTTEEDIDEVLLEFKAVIEEVLEILNSDDLDAKEKIYKVNDLRCLSLNYILSTMGLKHRQFEVKMNLKRQTMFPFDLIYKIKELLYLRLYMIKGSEEMK